MVCKYYKITLMLVLFWHSCSIEEKLPTQTLLGGMTMKRITINKISKRFLAFVMAVTMIMSNTLITSAAELNENTGTEEVLTVSDVEPITIEYALSDSDEGIMPLATSYINTSGYNKANGSKYQDSFTMARDEKLVVKLNVTGSCRMVVRLNGGILWTNLYDETVTNAQFWKITNENVQQGVKVTITLYFSGSSTDYSLSVWGE